MFITLKLFNKEIFNFHFKSFDGTKTKQKLENILDL